MSELNQLYELKFRAQDEVEKAKIYLAMRERELNEISASVEIEEKNVNEVFWKLKNKIDEIVNK